VWHVTTLSSISSLFSLSPATKGMHCWVCRILILKALHEYQLVQNMTNFILNFVFNLNFKKLWYENHHLYILHFYEHNKCLIHSIYIYKITYKITYKIVAKMFAIWLLINISFTADTQTGLCDGQLWRHFSNIDFMSFFQRQCFRHLNIQPKE
jgi:hypothetical protein